MMSKAWSGAAWKRHCPLPSSLSLPALLRAFHTTPPTMKRTQCTLSSEGSSPPARKLEADLENACPSPAKGAAPRGAPAAAVQPEKDEQAAVGEGPAAAGPSGSGPAAGPSGSRPAADPAAAKPRQQSWLKPQAPAVATAKLTGATGLGATRDLSRDDLLQVAHCEVVSNVLPAELAQAVLRQELKESKDWQCESWNFGGKLAALHHASCKYVFTVRAPRQRLCSACQRVGHSAWLSWLAAPPSLPRPSTGWDAP